MHNTNKDNGAVKDEEQKDTIHFADIRSDLCQLKYHLYNLDYRQEFVSHINYEYHRNAFAAENPVIPIP